MNDPRIVASAKGLERRTPEQAIESRRSWAVLGWIGFVFLLVGGADFALTWFPLDFGNPEWEFGTVTASFNGLPILLLGIGLLWVASDQLGRRWWGTLAVLAVAGLFLWIVVGLGLWSARVDLAFQTAPEELAVGVRRAVAKTLLQSVAYGTLLGYLLWQAFAGRRNQRIQTSK